MRKSRKVNVSWAEEGTLWYTLEIVPDAVLEPGAHSKEHGQSQGGRGPKRRRDPCQG